MKRILVLNLSATGHHVRYTRWILECQACREAEVVLAGPGELFSHPELRGIAGSVKCYAVHLSARQEKILGKASSLVAMVRARFELWKIWRKTYDEVSRLAKVDVVLMVCADDCLEAVPLIGSPFRTAPWAGITIRQKFHFARIGVLAPKVRFASLRGWLFRRALHNRYLAGILTNDPTFDEYANSYLNQLERKKLIFLPDAVVDHVLPAKASARESLGIAREAKVVLAYGALSERKGIRSLLEAVSSPHCPANICVLLAGQQSPEIAELLAGEAASYLQAQNRLKVINRYISDADETLLLAAADCMWIGYREFYMWSGVLMLAARLGIPCIVSDYGVSEYLMRKYHFGLVVNLADQATVLAALQEISQDTGSLEAKGQRGIAAFSRHSIPEFQNVMSAVIQRAEPIKQ